MNPATAIAYFIVSLATQTESGWPSQSWTMIEYPTRPICEAQVRAYVAYLGNPETVAQHKREKITIKIEPRCTSQPPQFLINDGGSR